MTTEQKLQKEIDRLTKALKVAQDLNAGLEADKDNAFRLVELALNRLPSRSLCLTEHDMVSYDPRRWYIQREQTPTGTIWYKLKDKK